MQKRYRESIPLAIETGKESTRIFISRAIVSTLLSAVLVLLWSLTGGGFFWPALPMAGLGIAIVARAISLFGEYSEVGIRRAMEDIGQSV